MRRGTGFPEEPPTRIMRVPDAATQSSAGFAEDPPRRSTGGGSLVGPGTGFPENPPRRSTGGGSLVGPGRGFPEDPRRRPDGEPVVRRGTGFPEEPPTRIMQVPDSFTEARDRRGTGFPQEPPTRILQVPDSFAELLVRPQGPQHGESTAGPGTGFPEDPPRRIAQPGGRSAAHHGERFPGEVSQRIPHFPQSRVEPVVRRGTGFPEEPPTRIMEVPDSFTEARDRRGTAFPDDPMRSRPQSSGEAMVGRGTGFPEDPPRRVPQQDSQPSVRRGTGFPEDPPVRRQGGQPSARPGVGSPAEPPRGGASSAGESLALPPRGFPEDPPPRNASQPRGGSLYAQSAVRRSDEASLNDRGLPAGPPGPRSADSGGRVPVPSAPLTTPSRGIPQQRRSFGTNGAEDQQMQPHLPGRDPANADPTSRDRALRTGGPQQAGRQPSPGHQAGNQSSEPLPKGRFEAGGASTAGPSGTATHGPAVNPPGAASGRPGGFTAAPSSPPPSSPTSAPTFGGTYGRASVPLRTAAPQDSAAASTPREAAAGNRAAGPANAAPVVPGFTGGSAPAGRAGGSGLPGAGQSAAGDQGAARTGSAGRPASGRATVGGPVGPTDQPNSAARPNSAAPPNSVPRPDLAAQGGFAGSGGAAGRAVVGGGLPGAGQGGAGMPGGSGGGGDPAPSAGAGATAWTGREDGRVEPVGVSETRTKKFVVLAVVVLLILVAAVIALVRPGPVKGWFSASGSGSGGRSSAPTTAATSLDAAATPVLRAASGGGRQPSASAVKAALDPLVNAKALGGTVHAAVLDVASNQVLYSRAADIPTTPASTTKVLTAISVLAARGPTYRIRTNAVAGSKPGEVVLVGGGDPTLAVDAKALFPGAARLDRLATQVKTALGGTKPTKVTIDTSLFKGPDTGLGWDSDDIYGGQVSRIQSLMVNGGRVKPVHVEGGGDPRSDDPALAAGKAFAKLLGVSAAAVKRGTAPRAGARLGVVQSPPLIQITDWMLQQSDNTIAEMMARQVALAAGKPASFDGASDAVLSTLRSMNLPSDEGDLYDGSGLSRHDGISPTLLTQALGLAASGRQPALTGLFGGLPVAGWSGTLADRFTKPAADRAGQGVVRAKTGTLSGVNTMAGELVTKDGRLLVFAIMASGSTNADAAKTALDKVVARLAGCGC